MAAPATAKIITYTIIPARNRNRIVITIDNPEKNNYILILHDVEKFEINLLFSLIFIKKITLFLMY